MRIITLAKKLSCFGAQNTATRSDSAPADQFARRAGQGSSVEHSPLEAPMREASLPGTDEVPEPPAEIAAQFAQMVHAAAAEHGAHAVRLLSPDRLRLTYAVSELSDDVRAAARWQGVDVLNLTLSFGPWYQFEEAPPRAFMETLDDSGRGTALSTVPGHDVMGPQLQAALNKCWKRLQAGEAMGDPVTTLFETFRQRLLDPGCHCIMCDKELKLEGLKPTVCDTALCQFQFMEQAGDLDRDELARQPEVAELLACMALAAAGSNRDRLVLPDRPMHYGKDEVPQLRDALQRIPNLATLGDHPLNERETALVRWLLVSNRTCLETLKGRERFLGVGTERQFHLRYANPERESAFGAMKQEHGSFLAFHGSPFENWHNILRNNLKNASGSDLMLHGAASGAGVYLADTASTSNYYARSSAVVRPGLGTSTLRCLALCEVAYKSQDTARRDVYVIKDDNRVVPRYLFVYDATQRIPAVSASALGKAQGIFANSHTPSGRPVKDIPRQRLFVTSMNLAYDLEELPAQLKAAGFPLRDPTTSRRLPRKDVAALRAKPEVWGALNSSP